MCDLLLLRTMLTTGAHAIQQVVTAQVAVQTTNLDNLPCCTCSRPPCLPQSRYSNLPLYTACHCWVLTSSSMQLHVQIHIIRSQSSNTLLRPDTYLVQLSIPAKDEVKTTRLTVSLDLATLSSTVVVPSRAGSTSSFCVSFHSAKKGEAIWKT